MNVFENQNTDRNDTRNYSATKNNLGLLPYSNNNSSQPKCYALPHFAKETYDNWHSAHLACIAWVKSVGVHSLSKIKTQKLGGVPGCDYRKKSFGCSKYKKRSDLNDPMMCSLFIEFAYSTKY